MQTTLLTDLTVKEICEGFVYNQLEGKGLFGWSGKLTIQPEYQRNYLYADKYNEEYVVGHGIGTDGAYETHVMNLSEALALNLKELGFIDMNHNSMGVVA